MFESHERPKGYRFPKTIISYAVYLYHRFLLSYRDVQEWLFKRGDDASHETVRVWCAKFGPDLAEALRHRKARPESASGRDAGGSGRGHALAIVAPLGCAEALPTVAGLVTPILWRAVNEHGNVLEV